MPKLIVRADSRREKRAVLFQIREEVEALKVLLRLCHDAQAFPNFNAFEHAIRQVTDVARQNEGWLKSQQRSRGQSRSAILDEIAEPSVP